MTGAISPDRARAVARAGAARLAAMVGDDGRFLYRYALNDPTFVSTTYSNVRHIAVVWGLADVEREGFDIPELAAAIDRAAQEMEQRLFRPYGTSGTLTVLDEGFYKLSGSALGVAAEAALLRRDGWPGCRDLIQRLARYVASQRESNGDFLPARVPGPIPKPYPTRDDLTPGQGVFALALGAEATADPALLGLAKGSGDAFAARDFLVGHSAHWVLYAVEALDRIAPDDRYRAYAERLVGGIAAMPAGDDANSIACVSEGLLAYARLLRMRGDQEAKIAAVLAQVERNLGRQLRFFHPSGAFIASATRQEVRIDTIMHNVLAFLGWARLME